MEKLDLYATWLENEKELLPLLEKIRPLLERRHALELQDPKLGLLREDRTLPGELPPPKLVGASLLGARAATLMVGTHVPLVGDPDRPVPGEGSALRALARAAKNRKKHDKEKARKKAKKAPEAPKHNMEEDPPRDPGSD